MRHARLLPAVLLALTAAACARQQPAYYVTDSMTGQRISAAQPSTTGRERGLFSSDASQPSAVRSYAYAQPQSQPSAERGLFSSGLFKRRSPAYAAPAPQPYPPQTYSYRPPQRPVYAQPSSATQYRPYYPQPAQQMYAQQPYPYQQPRPAGYHAERYGWY